MSRLRLLAALVALACVACLVAGCVGAPSNGGGTAAPTTSSEATGAGSPEASSTPTVTPAATVGVTLTTSKGVVRLELYPGKAPLTVANFVKLVKARFYDGILIHRVEPGFVVQAGDPQTRGMSAKRLRDVLARQTAGTSLAGDPAIGTGGPGWTIPLERNDLVHDRGVIAMARTQQPDTAGSQFYITLAPAHQLDGQYAVFGRVTSGMDVVDALAVGDVIRSARVTGK